MWLTSALTIIVYIRIGAKNLALSIMLSRPHTEKNGKQGGYVDTDNIYYTLTKEDYEKDELINRQMRRSKTETKLSRRYAMIWMN